ncbi:MAG: sigma-70 family RNA polymerase sigma factor [Defluviitaleaceae bacterium]|nr:sigma-70 family RNA polymerase sigma factor [Defluviitaleaceae bacterium]
MNAYKEVAPLTASVRKQHALPQMNATLLEAIYNEHYDNVHNYICFRINNHFDAEELANDVFINAIKRYDTYRPHLAPVQAWLIGIAKNTIVDYFRAKKRKTFVPLDDVVELASLARQPEDVVVFNETNRALMRAMSALKDKERQILSMKFATDLRNSEIADIMGVSNTNVATIANRAIIKLKKIMKREEKL